MPARVELAVAPAPRPVACPLPCRSLDLRPGPAAARPPCGRCRPCPASGPAGLVLKAERPLASAAALSLEGSEGFGRPRRSVDLDRLDRNHVGPLVPAKSAAYSPARLPKTSRSESELPPRRFAPCSPAAHLARSEQAGHGRHLRVGVHPTPPIDVVRGRPDLHRLFGDVDAGQFLELVVHARELLLDVRLGVGSFSLIQAMSRKTPPCGLPRPSLTSRTMQRATWSRVSSSGGRRASRSPVT